MDIIKKTENYVKKVMAEDYSGHDFWHIERVRGLALKLAAKEGGDKFIIELTALLHDIADWKFHRGDEEAGPRRAAKWLRSQKVQEKVIDQVCGIIREVSFKGAGVKIRPKTLEGRIVQDADKLDAMGAIGIGRTFAYGGSMGHRMHVPGEKPVLHRTFAQYKSSHGTTVNHFYEKLFLLKDRMNTRTAKKLAAARHKFMRRYVKEFYREWQESERSGF